MTSRRNAYSSNASRPASYGSYGQIYTSEEDKKKNLEKMVENAALPQQRPENVERTREPLQFPELRRDQVEQRHEQFPELNRSKEQRGFENFAGVHVKRSS